MSGNTPMCEVTTTQLATTSAELSTTTAKKRFMGLQRAVGQSDERVLFYHYKG